MIRVLKIAGLGVLALLMTLVLTLWLVLGTSSGSRWALGWVPGLQVEGFQGRLGGQWSATRALWQQGQQRVEVFEPVLQWAPSCLLRLTLCVPRLEARQIDVQLPPSTEPSADGPLQLADLRLPVGGEFGVVRVGSLRLNAVEQFQALQLSARWTAAGLQIDSARVQRDDLALELSATLDPQGQWPLQGQVQLQLPSVDGKAWHLNIAITGELLQSVQVRGQSSGYLNANIEGQVQPLAEHYPARLRLTSDAFKPSAGLPETLQLQQLQLLAEGDLQAGYKIDGQARLPAEQQAMALQLQGRVDAKGADITALDLRADDTHRVALSGRVDWAQGLAADAKLDWRDFPWQRLYPVAAEPAVRARQLTAEVSWRDGRYLGNFQSNLDGPAGAFSVASPFSGDLQRLYLLELQVLAGQGKAAGHLNLDFADGVAWDTALDLSNLDPAYWVAPLPGRLAGPLRSKGQWRDERLQADADLDLKGQLRGQPAVLLLKASGAGQAWTLGALDVRLGANRIHGSGSLEQRLAGRIDLDLPRLGQLWPDLQGRLTGRLDVAGTLQAPQGQLTLQGQQLAQATNRVQKLDLRAVLDSAQKGRVDLSGSGIRAGETDLGNLLVNGQGDQQRQQLQLSLQGPKLRTALGFDGTLQQGNWRGRLATGLVQFGGQDWRLQSPASLARLANGQIDLGAHCWRSGPASLCGEDQRLVPEPRLRYHLKQFPLQSLAQWLPKDFAWDGNLDADVALDLPASGPKGQLLIAADGGTLRVRDKGQWLSFPYQTLRVQSQLAPTAIDTQLRFAGGALGELQVDTRINPLPANKPLTGQFRLSGVDLSLARPFLPGVERLAGRLDGSGQISGGLLAPQVNGNITLSGGEVSGAELPISVEQLRLTAQIAGERVQLQGAWKSGEAGQGSLSGNVAWAQALAVDLQLKGSRLPVVVEPYAVLEAAPDLAIKVEAGRLVVAGKVRIPKGNITVRELPPSTVKLSDDAHIVGNQTEEGATPLAVAMDIDVQVGEDKLAFSGFGLTADLVGHVHIGDNLDTRGELNLKDGRYRAYGQRLTIRRARLLFAGPIDQPYLDIEAIRQTDDVIAGIRLTGNAEQPTTEVFSEPAMSQEQALSYLVLGRPLSTSGEDSNLVAQAALGLGLAGSSSTTGKLASDLGIEDFQLDTQGSGNTTSVVASGNLTERLTLRYGVGVFEPANTIALRYLLSKRVYLEAASGVASSLDIFYKRDF